MHEGPLYTSLFSMEHFIPFSKNDLGRLLSAKFTDHKQRDDFARFCVLIGSVYHYRMYSILEEFKASYLPLDPDRNIGLIQTYTSGMTESLGKKAFADLESILTAGNYTKITGEKLKEAFAQTSPRGLDLKVNTEVYELLNLYYRGEHDDRMEKKEFLFRKHYEFSVYDRVIIVFSMKETPVSPKDDDERHFEKGRLYLKLFKNVPTVDLEMLFPDTKIVIRTFDQVKVIVPLAAGAVTTLYKIISYITNAGNPVHLWSQIGFWILIGSLFGVALKAFLGYKNTVEKYLKTLTSSLYFQNLDNNSGVFTNLLDDAEEEECKELILAYYFLLAEKNGGLSLDELDKTVEAFFLKELGVKLDFEVDDALRKLREFGLLSDEKRLEVLPLDRSLPKLDDMWKALV